MNYLSDTQPFSYYECHASTPPVADALCALNVAGKAVIASDTAGLKCIGIAEAINNSVVQVNTSLLLLANDVAAGKISRLDRGAVAYVKDSLTVTKTPGTNKIFAGIIVDVTHDNEVAVDCSPVALAVAKSII